MQIDSSLSSQGYAAGILLDLADRERMKNKIFRNTTAAANVIIQMIEINKTHSRAAKDWIQ